MKIFFHSAKKYLMRKIFWEIFFHSQNLCAQIFPQVERHESEGNFIFKENEKGRDDRAPQFFASTKKLFERKRKIIILRDKKMELLKSVKQLLTTRAVLIETIFKIQIVESETQNVLTLSVERCNSQRDTFASNERWSGGLNQFRKRTKKKRFYWANSTCRPRRNVSRFDPPFWGCPQKG